jgi:hypothetical protein
MSLHIADSISSDLFKEFIIPLYRKDLKDLTTWRYKWRKIANYCEAGSKVLVALSTIITFAAGSYANTDLIFVGGSTNTIALSLLLFSSYATKESSERTEELNSVLRKLQVEEVANLVVNGSDKDESPVNV